MKTKSHLILLLFIITTAIQPIGSVKADPCYRAQFVADVTIPDGTTFAANTAFKKTWRIKNIGSCAWNTGDVSLIFDRGERMSAPASLGLPNSVSPNQTVDITVDMIASSSPGRYFGYWKFSSASGGIFGIGSKADRSFWVEINVTSPTSTGYDFTANASSAAWSSGYGILSFPFATDGPEGSALLRDTPYLENGSTPTQAGLLFVPNNMPNGYVQAAYPALRVQSGDRYQAAIGCEYGATNCYVAYGLYYQIGSGPVRTYWTFREKYEGLIYNVDLDLTPLANQDVKFILTVSAYGSAYGDRALWVNPIIARPGGYSPVTVTPSPLPDLVITSVYLGMQGIPGNPTSCIPNHSPYEIRVTVLNRGQDQAVNIPILETATGVQLTIGLLRAGQSVEVNFPAGAQSSYKLLIDPQNLIRELDESNNAYSYLPVTPTPPVICTASPTATPHIVADLMITNIYLGIQGIPGQPNSSCIVGFSRYEIRAIIQNKGTGPAYRVPILETSTGTEIMIDILQAGQSIELAFPANSASGYYTVTVDMKHAAPDFDWSNNSLSYFSSTPTPPAICTPVSSSTPTATWTPTATATSTSTPTPAPSP